MTAYFDDFSNKLRDGPLTHEFLEQMERNLVEDCLLPTQLDNFPKDFVEMVYRVVLNRGLLCLPVNAYPRVNPRDQAHHKQILFDLSFDLHSVYHQIATAGGLSDSPLAWRRLYLSRSEERMEQIAEAMLDEVVIWSTSPPKSQLIDLIYSRFLLPKNWCIDFNGKAAIWKRKDEEATDDGEWSLLVDESGSVYDQNGRCQGQATTLNDVPKILKLERKPAWNQES